METKSTLHKPLSFLTIPAVQTEEACALNASLDGLSLVSSPAQLALATKYHRRPKSTVHKPLSFLTMPAVHGCFNPMHCALNKCSSLFAAESAQILFPPIITQNVIICLHYNPSQQRNVKVDVMPRFFNSSTSQYLPCHFVYT